MAWSGWGSSLCVITMLLTVVRLVLQGKLVKIDVVVFRVTDFLVEGMAPVHWASSSRRRYWTSCGVRAVDSDRWDPPKLLHQPHYYAWEVPRIMSEAERRGGCMLQWVVAHFPDHSVPSNAVEAAAEFGHSRVESNSWRRISAIEWSADDPVCVSKSPQMRYKYCPVCPRARRNVDSMRSAMK